MTDIASTCKPRLSTPAGIQTSYLEAGSGPPGPHDARLGSRRVRTGPTGSTPSRSWPRSSMCWPPTWSASAPPSVRTDIRYSLRAWTDHVWAFLDALGIEPDRDRRQLARWPLALQMAEDDARADLPDGADGLARRGHDPHRGTEALRAYEPSHGDMRALLRNYFAVDPSMITDELVGSGTKPASPTARTRLTARCSSILGTREPNWASPRRRCARSARPRCSSTAARTRWCRRGVLSMVNLLPNADLHVFATADTGPKSSAPPSSTRWSKTTSDRP